MIQYKIEVNARGPLLKEGIPEDLVTDEINNALHEMGALGMRLVQERTPRGVSAGAGLRGSIFYEVYGQPLQTTAIIGTPTVYAPMIEAGRAPGRFPPVAALALWVRRKLGVSDEAELKRVTFLIARKIARVGFAGYFMFERAAQQLVPIVYERFRAAAMNIAKRLGQ